MTNPKPEIIIAIPTYNEADNIKRVAQAVDKGLKQYFPRRTSLILNADNHSPDQTKKVFLNTKTRVPKLYLASGSPQHRGKGLNIKAALNYAKKVDALAMAFIDGDLKSIQPVWVKKLISPILKRKVDFVLPVYFRNRYDGTITNNIVYPALYGVFGADISQPIGGEFGVSRKAAACFLTPRWIRAFNHYGVDIFLTTESIINGLKMEQVILGAKDHKPSLPKLDQMFEEVAFALFRQIFKHGLDLKGRVKKVKVSENHLDKKPPIPSLKFDSNYALDKARTEYQKNKRLVASKFKPFADELKTIFENGDFSRFDYRLWAKIYVFLTVQAVKANQLTISDIKTLKTLFFGRVVGFYSNTISKDDEFARLTILKQAKLFRRYLKGKNSQF